MQYLKSLIQLLSNFKSKARYNLLIYRNIVIWYIDLILFEISSFIKR